MQLLKRAEFRIAVLLEDGFEDDELRTLMELFETRRSAG